MQSFYQLPAVIAAFCVLVVPSVFSAVPTGETAAGKKASPEQIDLDLRQIALSDAVGELSRRSGVRFSVSPGLESDPLDLKIEATNWNDAIKAFLAGYSYLATVDHFGKFQKIWITSTGDPVSNRGTDNHSGGASPGDVAAQTIDLDGKLLPLELWEPLQGEVTDSPWEGSVRAEPVQMDAATLDDIRVGQPIELPIPQEDTPVFGVIGETHSQLGGEVQVWSGPIDGTHETASFTITRGERTTYVTVATGTSIYEASIDNATGTGSVVDEVELTKHVTENDYIIPDEHH